MFGQRSIFVLISLVALSLMASLLSRQSIPINNLTIVAIVAGVVDALSIGILVTKRKKLAYRLFTEGKTFQADSDILKLLGISSITPKENFVLASSNGKLVGHSYVRISDVPYLIDDLDRDRKLYFVQNFVRILSSLTFHFEIIPRIMPVSTEAYLHKINKEIENLKLTLSAEGRLESPTRQARLKHLERLASRLLSGEGARDVSFLLHVIVEGKSEDQIRNQLETNTKSLVSALESGLGIRATRATGNQMLEVVKEFFRASPIVTPSRYCRILCWDLAYLIPLTRPKLPPISKLLDGVYIGTTTGDSPVCLDLSKYHNPHIHVKGTSGSGKSTTVKTFLSRHFDLYETPALILDYSGEYGDWVASRDGKVIDMQKSRINPFEVGPELLVNRIQQIVDSFAASCEFNTINQRNVFLRFVIEAYEAKGFLLDDPATWKKTPPTLSHIVDLMKTKIGKAPLTEQVTIQSLLVRLTVLAQGPFGVFGDSTISYHDLTTGFICVDLSKISSNSLKDLIAWTILQYIDSNMRQELNTDIKLIVVLDEAWKLCRDENSIPVKVVKEGRKHGYALITSSQDLADTAEPILSNSGTTILHRTENPRYLEYFRKAYDLTETELSRLRNLPVGEALVKIGLDPKPFFVKVDMEQVERRQNQVSYEKPSLERDVSDKLGNIRSIQDGHLSEQEEAMLKVIQEEILPIRRLYEKLQLNEYQGNRVKNCLLQKGIAKTVKLPSLSKTGRRPEALVPIQEQAGCKGATIHRYAVNTLATFFQERGRKAVIEYKLDTGESIDLVVDQTIAIEVETGESNIKVNADKLRKSNFGKKGIICLTNKAKREAENCNAGDLIICSFEEVGNGKVF